MNLGEWNTDIKFMTLLKQSLPMPCAETEVTRKSKVPSLPSLFLIVHLLHCLNLIFIIQLQ